MAEQTTIVRIKVEGTSEMAKLKQEIVATEESLKKTKGAYKEGAISQKQYAKSATDTETKLKGLKKEFNQQQKELVTLNTEVKKAEGSYASLAEQNKKLSVQVRNLANPLGKNKKEFQELSQKISQNTNKMKEMDAAMGRFHKNVGNYNSGFKNFATRVAGIGIAVQGAIMAFQQMERVVGVFVDFQFAMKQVGAITQATEEEFKALEQSAKDLGASTAFTASEVAGLQLELGKLGFDPTQINNMTSSILDLAFAFDEDLGATAEQVGFVLKQFQLESEDSTRVADVMATAFTNTALDMQKFQVSMQKVGVVANTMGFDLEDTVSMLGLLADMGFDASSAGTALRNIMLKMADPAGDLAKQLSIQVNSIEDLGPAFKELQAKGIDVADALEMTDKRSAAAFISMVQNGERLEELNGILNDSEGAVKTLAETMRDTLKGDIDELKSAAEGAAIELIEQFEPALRAVADAVTFVFQAIGPAIKILKPFIAAWASYKLLQAGLVLGEKAFAAALAVKNTVMAIATGKQKLFNKAVIANPYMAVAAAIIGLIVLIDQLMGSYDKAAEKQKDINMRVGEMKFKNEELSKSTSKYNAIAQDETKTTEERQRAVDILNERFKGLQITLENIGDTDIQAGVTQGQQIAELENELSLFKAVAAEYETEVAQLTVIGEDGLVSWKELGFGAWSSENLKDAFGGATDAADYFNEAIVNAEDGLLLYQIKSEQTEEKLYNLEKSFEALLEKQKNIRIETADYDNTISGLQQKVKEYSEKLNDLVIGSAGYNKWLKKLKEAKGELSDATSKLNEEVKKEVGAFKELSAEVSRIENEIKNYLVQGKDTSKLETELVEKKGELIEVNKEYDKILQKNGFTQKDNNKAQETFTQLINKSNQAAIQGAQRQLVTLENQKESISGLSEFLLSEEQRLIVEQQILQEKGVENLNKSEKEKLKIIKNNLKAIQDMKQDNAAEEIQNEMKILQQKKIMLEKQLESGYKVREENGKKVIDLQQVLSDDEIAALNSQLAEIGVSLMQFQIKLDNMKNNSEGGDAGFLDTVIFGKEGAGGITPRQFMGMVADTLDAVSGLMGDFQQLQNTRTAARIQGLEEEHFIDMKNMQDSAAFQNATEEQQAQMTLDLERQQAQTIYDINVASFEQNKKAQRSMAVIDGASAVMRIWAAPSTLPFPADVILKGIMTIAQAARTKMQLATIDAAPPPPKPQILLEYGGIPNEIPIEYFATGGTTKGKGEPTKPGVPSKGGGKTPPAPPTRPGSGQQTNQRQGTSSPQVMAGGMRKVEELLLIQAIQDDFADAQRTTMSQLSSFALGGRANGVVIGPSHADGGVKFGMGDTVAELEGGEAIINKKSTSMFRPLLSAINVAGGGRKFAEGGIALDDQIMEQLWGTGLLDKGKDIAPEITITEAEITNTQETVSILESRSTF